MSGDVYTSHLIRTSLQLERHSYASGSRLSSGWRIVSSRLYLSTQFGWNGDHPSIVKTDVQEPDERTSTELVNGFVAPQSNSVTRACLYLSGRHRLGKDILAAHCVLKQKHEENKDSAEAGSRRRRSHQ